MMKRAVIALVVLMVLSPPRFLFSQDRGVVASPSPQDQGAEQVRVLVIGAHPDDEDTQLISWLQRGGRAQTAYLSLTRGDGGQNLIGNELGEMLGIIRTEELLAARRVDGAHQFFTRAYDFGYSKSAAETFAHWPKDSLLNDVVQVVRAFRPHIIVSIFSGTPRDGHGQHQVSGILAREAYDSAADTVRFAVSRFGSAWTPLKLYRSARFSPDAATLRFNVGEYNETLGRSYAEIAGESRSQHKSQGFGTLQRKGVILDFLRREHSRVNAPSDPNAETSLFDGLGRAGERPDRRQASGTAEKTTQRVFEVLDNEQRLVRSGIAVEAISDREYVAVGDSARVTVTVFNRSRSPLSVLLAASGNGGSTVSVASDSAYRWTTFVKGAEITQPWWLATPRNGDLFAPRIGLLPEDELERSRWISVPVAAAGGDATVIRAPVVFRIADAVRGDVQRPLAVAPLISVTLARPVELARANSPLDRFFNVTLRSASMSSLPVTVSLVLPPGLRADSASRLITVDSAGTRTLRFRVRGRVPAGSHVVSARAMARGSSFSSGFARIDYEHISPQRHYRPAAVRLAAIDVAVEARLSVGYIPGVGDNVAPALAQLGIPVAVIDPSEIPTVDLSRFSTIVVGPRAYEAHRDLPYNNPYLLEFARRGGTVVVQFGQYEMMRPGMMPHSITINRPHDRVAEENAPVTLLDASSPAFRQPNTITAADFEGWVQERGLYMPRAFDERYKPLVATNDPGEPVNRGGILVTPHGRGLYIYTTLAFFRQLPAGVSGGTRLFVNLLSMRGK
ncbi:MAG: PIG-L family deacetylase [Gemmatimonadaceae bacterium]|nr:PIG-L family deacetylase [Gemmatimonadaceae bacterium]